MEKDLGKILMIDDDEDVLLAGAGNPVRTPAPGLAVEKAMKISPDPFPP